MRLMPKYARMPNRILEMPHSEYGFSHWTYPEDWPDIRWPINDSIELLYCDAGTHTAAFRVKTTAGQYHVDWGDGNTSDHNSDATAEHAYTAGAGTPCSRGYTTWKITITAASGNIDRFYVYPNSVQTQNNQSGILAACFNTPGLTSMANAFYYSSGAGVRCPFLEYFKMQRVAASVTNSSYAFTNCWRLMYANVDGLTGVTNASGMFNSCTSLLGVDLSKMTAIQTADSLFAYCYSLKYADFSAQTEFTAINQICRQCGNLGSIKFAASLPNVTTFEYGCYACLTLRTVDISGMINVTNLNYAFQNCYNLQTADLDGLTDVTTMISCFNGCYNLETLSATNFAADAASVVGTDAFALCELLTSIAMAGAKFTVLGAYGASGKLNKATTITFHASSTFSGASPQFKMIYNDMSAAQINAIFTALPTVTGKTIDITGCTGAATCDSSIATGKGWTVTGGP